MRRRKLELTIKGDVKRLALGPDDIAVITVPGDLTIEQVERIKDQVSACIPDRKVMVLCNEMSITKLSPEEARRLSPPPPTDPGKRSS